MNLKILSFYKEKTHKWYINLPEWTGSKEDLEMVMGADNMLDYLAQGEDTVVIYVSLEPSFNYEYELTLDREDEYGAYYYVNGNNLDMEIWLCPVTKFVFGNYPNKIYFIKSNKIL